MKSLLPVDENEDPFRVGMRDELTLCEGDVINGGVQVCVFRRVSHTCDGYDPRFE